MRLPIHGTHLPKRLLLLIANTIIVLLVLGMILTSITWSSVAPVVHFQRRVAMYRPTRRQVTVLAVVLILLLGFFAFSPAFAEPVMRVVDPKGTSITLYGEPCARPDLIANMPNRATYFDAAEQKTYEGCFDIRAMPMTTGQPYKYVTSMFEDRTTIEVPTFLFEKVKNI